MKILSATVGLVLIAAMGNTMAASEKNATDSPAAQTSKTKQPQQMQHRRGPKQYALAGADGATITLWKPDLTTMALEQKHLMHGTITLPSTGLDNYHAIVAEKDWGDSKEAVIRYEYLRGKPSKYSPTILSDAVKTRFEIVPDPIPRGHYHYFTGQEWNFRVRFLENPIPNLPVLFETANGSRYETMSDAKGRFSVTIPTDFPNMVPGEKDRRSSDFMLSAEYKNEGIHYQSALSAEYRVNRLNWRSVELGFAVAGIGILGVGLVRLSKNSKRGRA
jgi:hypothetical protein